MGNLSANTIWNEEVICEEIKKLDEKTGFSGASLPIKIGKAKYRVGYFEYNRQGPLAFHFSGLYFNSPEIDLDDKIDVIRHEYAHYMDYMRNGFYIGYDAHGHGNSWKLCCKEIGARPSRYIGTAENEYYKKLYADELEKIAMRNEFRVNDRILHPKYGVGVITGIYTECSSPRATVKYGGVGELEMSLDWIAENCELLMHVTKFKDWGK